MPLLTIIIPVYNEAKTISKVIERVEAAQLPENFTKEIIIIDDGSTDGTSSILDCYKSKYKVILSPNTGKGGAVRKGFLLANGDFIIVQDADLEQNPNDFYILLTPLLEDRADVVFGSRFLNDYRPKTLIMNIHYLINIFFTFSSNILTGYRTTDVWTGYKMFSRDALLMILPHLKSDGIEFELEISMLLSKFHFEIYDVSISYQPRWYENGKKTDWKQAINSFMKLISFYFKSI